MKQRSFTLIEVLVVVAIIGFLASITLVSIKEARERARVAVGLNFAAQVHHALGAYAVGVWDFDEGADNTCVGNRDVCDSSGYNNHLENYGAVWACTPDDTPTGNGCSLNIDNKGDYLELNSDINNSIITTTMWYYYNGNGGSWNTLLCRDGGSYHHLLIQSGSQEIGFYNSGWYSSGYSLTQGNWYHITLVKNGTNSKIYINGDLKQDRSDSFNNASYPLKVIGNYGGYSQGALGFIDQVRVYKEALTSAQIKKLYVGGAKKKDLAVE